MKVLFIDHPEADYVAAALYMGLCQELGPHNVIDWPYKPSYHGKTDRYPSFYTPGEMGITEPHQWMIANPLEKVWTQNEVASTIDSFDLVILSSPRKNNHEALVNLISVVGRKAIKKLAIIDGEDYDCIRWDKIEDFHPDIYFKRELVPNPQNIYWAQKERCEKSGNIPRFSPISISTAIDQNKQKNVVKDIDILFLGGNNKANRASFINALQNAFGNRLVHGHMKYDEYLSAHARAKMAICNRGHGWDTLRFYEIPSHRETLLVAERALRIMEYPLIDGEHCTYFDTPEELVKVCDFYLNNEEKRKSIAISGNQWISKYHTTHGRARWVLEESFR